MGDSAWPFFVTAIFKRRDEIRCREVAIAIPITFGPSTVASDVVFVLTGDENLDQIARVEFTVPSWNRRSRSLQV